MPLLAGDIRFARSANMADVSEGGGPPSSQLLTSGRSNEIFPDISEETRTTGRVEIYQIFGVLRNTDRTPFMGCNVILAEPPADPNVSVTLLSLKSPFATRADIARRIESGMAAGSEFSGYLLENHYTTMRSIQIFQRPGMPPPAIGRTFVLVYNEGQAGERRQRIRVKATDTVIRMFTELVGGQLVDFQAQVTTCELFDGLLYDFPGSPATRTFARAAGKTLTRETVYSDSGLFYSATRLTAATAINDAWLQLASIYTQVVPNSRSEVASVDQMPAARRTIVLAEAPRRVEVGITPHTQRYKIQEENAGLTFVWQCTPLPEPGTVFIDYWSLGQRYTLTDDGTGKLVGAGGGAVNYLTGSISATLKSIPDIGSSIALTHGARVSYTNRANQGAAIRPPEYCWVVGGQDEATKHDRIVPGTLVVKYPSGGVVRTVTEADAGKLAGAATGVVDYHSRTVLLRPSFMPDPGAELQVDCQLETLVTEFINGGPDAAGFAAFTLAQQPAAGTLQIEWCVARAVSQTAGGNLTTTTSSKTADVNYIFKATPEWQEPQSPGQNIAIRAAYV
ncbi:hypothetical protein [Delftia deserti]|uniref:Tip attachment protein J domain-containing protein n=1 Tax=Delftia deserti TaxID=1651218 RepID=A0ABW5EJA4_9BURK